MGDNHEHVLELESILTALSHLAPADETDPDKIRERQREKEVIRKRLAALTDSSEAARRNRKALGIINGVKGVPHSFDRLEDLLSQQSYRLSFWKVAADEINYRRFFDINELAAVRVEDPDVFQAMHALVFELVKEGMIDGLRVDHSDGLLRSRGVLSPPSGRLPVRRKENRPFLCGHRKDSGGKRKAASDWDIEGTTGYDFLGLMNGLFVDPSRRRAFIACTRPLPVRRPRLMTWSTPASA